MKTLHCVANVGLNVGFLAVLSSFESPKNKGNFGDALGLSISREQIDDLLASLFDAMLDGDPTVIGSKSLGIEGIERARVLEEHVVLPFDQMVEM